MKLVEQYVDFKQCGDYEDCLAPPKGTDFVALYRSIQGSDKALLQEFSKLFFGTDITENLTEDDILEAQEKIDHYKQPGCGKYGSSFIGVDASGKTHAPVCVFEVPFKIVSLNYYDMPIAGLTPKEVSFDLGIAMGQFSAYSLQEFNDAKEEELLVLKQERSEIRLDALDQASYQAGFKLGRKWKPKPGPYANVFGPEPAPAAPEPPAKEEARPAKGPKNDKDMSELYR